MNYLSTKRRLPSYIAGTANSWPRLLDATKALAAVCLLAGCAATQAPHLSAMSPSQLASAFAGCFSPLGVSGAVGQLAPEWVPPVESLEQVALSGAAIVSDGFHHALFLDRARGAVYIQQTGGIAGVQNWYGPLTWHAHCSKIPS